MGLFISTPRARPVFTFYFMTGCPACAAAKPEVTKVEQLFAARLPDAIEFRRVDLSKVKGEVDIPVPTIPAFRLQAKGKDHFIEAKTLAERDGLQADFEGIMLWLKSVTGV